MIDGNVLRRLLLFCLAFLLLPGRSEAQTQFMRDFAKVQNRIWTSPFRQPQKSAMVGLPLAAGASALLLVDQGLINRQVPQAHPWGTRLSRAGDFAVLAGSTAVLWGAGRLIHNEAAADIGRQSALALVNASVVNTALKASVLRRRPDGSNRWSFPSGHAMTSFAVASAIASHPKTPRWARIALPALAAGVSVARVGARRHYPSDVAVGAALGWLIGRAAHH